MAGVAGGLLADQPVLLLLVPQVLLVQQLLPPAGGQQAGGLQAGGLPVLLVRLLLPPGEAEAEAEGQPALVPLGLVPELLLLQVVVPVGVLDLLQELLLPSILLLSLYL